MTTGDIDAVRTATESNGAAGGPGAGTGNGTTGGSGTGGGPGLAAAREELLRARLAGRSIGGRRSTIGRADRSGPLPLSYGQQQMWFLNRLETNSPEYLVPLALRLRGPLDVDRLGAAWQALLARHEILRTRYTLTGRGADEAPVQVVDEVRPVRLDVVEVPGDTVEEREAAAYRLVEQDCRTPFDLAEQWPVRAGLLRLADDDHVLVLVFHHIACDAWSLGVVGRELARLYAGGTLPPLPIQYADYAAWERARDDRHLDYWRTRLSGLTPLEVPADRPRPAVRDWRGAVHSFDLPESLAGRLRELASRHDATLFMVLMTAFQALLSRYTGQTDVPVGTMVSGRSRPELRDLVGYGINSLVVRTAWSGDPTFVELLGRTREAVLGAFDHQEVPFARLVDELQPERDMSRTPLFQVALTVQGARTQAFELSGLAVEPLSAASTVSRFDLTALFDELPGGALRGHLEYATALFDPATVSRLAGHLTRLLAGVAERPETPVSALALLDAEELALLTRPPVRTVPVTARVHELFEAQVVRSPGAVAVVAGGVELSYGEVNERANRVA
ncbi:condensation domain-containing protein, partial [Plantactinospora sp. B24E8]|uniref:condensation domain-containing protein n=1 Tax=Plantactinospora sp. B24E8 TaxID=3153567 RepID=UPI00325E2CF9